MNNFSKKRKQGSKCPGRPSIPSVGFRGIETGPQVDFVFVCIFGGVSEYISYFLPFCHFADLGGVFCKVWHFFSVEIIFYFFSVFLSEVFRVYFFDKGVFFLCVTCSAVFFF